MPTMKIGDHDVSPPPDLAFMKSGEKTVLIFSNIASRCGSL